jgi:predicted RNA binding protein YcfA (HicA-like mRNA interferase family)
MKMLLLEYQRHNKLKYSELYRILERNGWHIKRTKKHHVYAHPDKEVEIMVGRHKSEEVPKGTLVGVLKQAGLK